MMKRTNETKEEGTTTVRFVAHPMEEGDGCGRGTASATFE